MQRLNLIRLAGLLVVLQWAMASWASAEPVKILPLGDSWTSGYGEYVSYRYDLWFELVASGYEVDFVGSKDTTPSLPNAEWYPDYATAFDRDHEGYSGLRSDQLIPYVQPAATAFAPDIVLLWAGGNDILFGGPSGVVNAEFGLRDIINELRAVVPEVTILLALNPPYFGSNAGLVDNLNEVIVSLAAELDRAESPIVLVDHYTGYDIESMTWDGVHQNRVGEAWVAANWFEAIAGVLTGSEPVPINAGHAGAWFNPATSGQGVLLDIEPEDQYAFLAWFTYSGVDSALPGDPHWFTAQGNFSANRATLPVYETLGGRFDDPAPVITEPVGQLTLRFDDCSSGTVTYSIDHWGVQGSFPIERLIPGSQAVCRQIAGESIEAIDINPGMSGGWFDPGTSGQGFLLDVHSGDAGDDFLFAAWFTFGDDTSSGQRWLTAQGAFQGQSAEIDVYETTGGRFDDPQLPETVPVGSMNIEFSDCGNAALSYSLDDGAEGTVQLTRLLPKASRLCEELAASQ